MIIEAADILRQQADLRDRFRDPVFRRGVETQFASIAGANHETKNLASRMGEYIENAKAYRVEQQMTDVIMERAKSYDDDFVVPVPPSAYGFVVLEEPIPFTEIRGKQELIHVIQWAPLYLTFKNGSPGVDAVMTSCWNDISRQPDETYAKLVRPYLEQAGFREYQDLIRRSGRWSLQSWRPVPAIPVGKTWAETDDEYAAQVRRDGDEPEQFTLNMIRVFAALFDLLGERIPAANKTPAVLNRSESKQARRAGIEPGVTLVTLRPEYKPSPETRGTGHPISVKYAMGNPDDPDSIAYYRTIHRGTPRERRVPVRSHWRGDPEAPVSEKKKVYNLAR